MSNKKKCSSEMKLEKGISKASRELHLLLAAAP